MIKFYLILISSTTFFILKVLYTVTYRGEFIVKEKKDRASYNIWIVFLIIWCIFLILSIRGYIHNKNNYYIYNIIGNIIWIEASIFNLIIAYVSSQIRESGVYNAGNFYKWSKIQGYSWTTSNTIQFKVKTFFKTSKNFEFVIKEELISKVDEAVQKYIHS